MNYIIDEEINLEEKDYLNSKQYAKALKEIIDSVPKNKVFTLGLFGGWGSGKSSIIKTTEELYKNDKSVKFIKYDAWQYGNDSFRRTFLITLCDQMSMNKDRFLKGFYNKETKDIKFEHKLSPFAIVCLREYVIGVQPVARVAYKLPKIVLQLFGAKGTTKSEARHP